MRLRSPLQREDNPAWKLLWIGFVSMSQSLTCLPDLLLVRLTYVACILANHISYKELHASSHQAHSRLVSAAALQ